MANRSTKKPRPKAKPRPVGRPSEYDPAYCLEVVKLGKQGMSRAEIASALDCSKTTLTAWEGEHPEFLTALQRARDESLAWWEMKARGGIDKGSAFNAQLWAKSVSGRFPSEPYRDRIQVSGPGDGPVPVDLTKASDEQLNRLENILGEIAVAIGNPGGEGSKGG